MLTADWPWFLSMSQRLLYTMTICQQYTFFHVPWAKAPQKKTTFRGVVIYPRSSFIAPKSDAPLPRFVPDENLPPSVLRHKYFVCFQRGVSIRRRMRRLMSSLWVSDPLVTQRTYWSRCFLWYCWHRNWEFSVGAKYLRKFERDPLCRCQGSSTRPLSWDEKKILSTQISDQNSKKIQTKSYIAVSNNSKTQYLHRHAFKGPW